MPDELAQSEKSMWVKPIRFAVPRFNDDEINSKYDARELLL
jgi:hypothetical protein